MNHRPNKRFVTPALIIIGVACLLMTACSNSHRQYIPVVTDQPRVSTLGFSVKPPPGTGWYEKVQNSSLIYLKKSSTDQYRLSTRATELQFNRRFKGQEEFLAYVRAVKEIGFNPEQYLHTDSDFRLSDSTGYCVHYRQNFADRRTISPGTSHSPRAATISHEGLLCRHPDDESVGIDLSYSERVAAGSHFSHALEGEQFLQSLSFLPRNR